MEILYICANTKIWIYERKSLDKNKIEVGDISIKAVVAKNHKMPNYNFKVLQNISLNVVMTLADIVAEGITKTIKYIV